MGAATTGSPSKIQPNTYNSFQQAVMSAQENAGQAKQGMFGREEYMNSGPMYQEIAAGGENRAGMLGGPNPGSFMGNMQNAAVENSAANNAGMLGNVETAFNMNADARAEQEVAGMQEGIDLGPGRGRRVDRRTEAMERRGRGRRS